jgi:hypothetical protein
MNSKRFSLRGFLPRLPLIILLFTCLLPASSSPAAQAVEVVVEEPELHPAFSTCKDSYWYDFLNARGSTTYLTLNVNDPAYSSNSGNWRPVIVDSGYYRIDVYIANHGSIVWCNDSRWTIEHDTTDARYAIHHVYGTTNRTVNQDSFNNQWVTLGEYYFNAGNNGYVALTDLNGEQQFSTTVSFSAMRFTYTRATRPQVFLPLMHYTDPSGKPPPDTGVVQAQGFDVCSLPSISKMQTWWNASPYSFFGLYLGGIHFASFCTKADAAWVKAVHDQGWSFIPTWVGPQAPCSRYTHKISLDPLTAYHQGRQEAEAASAAANTVGLTNYGWGGTVIYYDLEGFSGANLECRHAVASFMNGWTERLHEYGNSAGGYGGPCSSYITDWSVLEHIPDVIWPAYWTRNAYDPNKSVYGLPCVSDNLWAHHQRLLQYGGELNESWGGVTLNLDINVADGMVAMPPAKPLGKPTLVTISSIEDTGWLSTDQGWLVSDNRLYWTENQGNHWSEISPASVQMADFLPSGPGWAISTQDQSGAKFYHTTDRGKTWSMNTLSLPPDGWLPLQLKFTSSTSGWMVLQKETSQAFSIGILMKTNDSGRTWLTYNLPVAGKITFNSINEAQLQDSHNDTVYRSTDGGLTWTLEKFDFTQVSKSIYPTDTTLSGWQTTELGWAVTSNGSCSGDKSTSSFACQASAALYQTVDAGRQWEAIPIPAPNSPDN